MDRIVVGPNPRPVFKIALWALLTVFVAAQVASAQIGAIKEAKGVTEQKPSKSIDQGFEKGAGRGRCSD